MLRVIVGRGTLSAVCRRQLSAVAAPSEPPKIDKEALRTLRQRTGYSFVNCKKALLQFGPDRLGEAESWLKELAKKEGWAKAAKLSSRATTQGLVGVKVDGGMGVVVELSCETDFVSRGEPFRELLTQLTSAVLVHASKQSQEEWKSEGEGRLATTTLVFDELADADGRSLRSILTESVGRIGENLTVRSIHAFRSPSDTQLFAASHPKETLNGVSMGKFASLVALRREKTSQALFPSERLADQLCQHVIGMRSEGLGEPPMKKEEQAEAQKAKEDEDELNEFFAGQTTSVDESETCLLRQSFMLNPSQTVYEYLQHHKAQVLDFARVELTGAGDD